MRDSNGNEDGAIAESRSTTSHHSLGVSCFFLDEIKDELAKRLFLQSATGKARYITFAGPARIREALAMPRPMFKDRKVKHRPDGISVAR